MRLVYRLCITNPDISRVGCAHMQGIRAEDIGFTLTRIFHELGALICKASELKM